MSRRPRHVVIIGGGITGLATAFALEEQPPSSYSVTSTLIEASPRLGGKILTEHVEGFVIEGGPDSFLAQKPWGIELCQRLGLANSLMGTNPHHRKTFVLLDRRLHELPEGLVMGLPTKLSPFLRTRMLSWSAKLRMAGEFFLPPGRQSEDESIASFFRRRLGKQAVERIIEPLLTGIYTGDAEQLSLLATFPRFREMEQEHGSLVRAMLRGAKQRDDSGWTPFVTLREGLALLVQTLAGKLQHTTVVTGTVQALRHAPPQGYEVVLSTGSMVKADAVVVTTPAFVAGSILDPLDRTLSETLGSIPYTSSATVSVGFHQKDVPHALDGYGFVVPRIEHRPLIASTWTSSKWEHRAPPGNVLIRCYYGGTGRETILERSDGEFVQMARDELGKILQIQHPPVVARVYRWPRAMPQYQVGHLRRLAVIAQHLERLPGIILAGAAYRGVGLPDCIRDGQTAAGTVLRYFDKETTSSV